MKYYKIIFKYDNGEIIPFDPFHKVENDKNLWFLDSRDNKFVFYNPPIDMDYLINNKENYSAEEINFVYII